jgi:lipopolysaccharide export system permease protein
MIIHRYLAREIVTALSAVMIVLLLAFVSQQVVRYLNYVAIGKIPLNVLMQLVAFEIPYLLAFLLPLAAYLGILLTYGRLYADNEMIVLMMAGFDKSRVMRFTAVVALFISGMVLVLMLWVNPLISAKRQQVMQSDEATLHLIQTIMPGRFQVSSDGHHVMYVEKLSRDHQRAQNVFIAKEVSGAANAAQPNWSLVLADQGYQAADKKSDSQFFVTVDGYRYEGVPGQNDYKIVQFKKYAVRIPPSDIRVMHMQDETLPTASLWDDYVNPKRAAELQWRFSIGISAFLLALLAVPLSKLRPRQGRYLVLLPAALIYILYVNLMFVSRHWVEQGTVPIAVGMWWVHLLMVLFAVMVVFGQSWRNSGRAV